MHCGRRMVGFECSSVLGILLDESTLPKPVSCSPFPFLYNSYSTHLGVLSQYSFRL